MLRIRETGLWCREKEKAVQQIMKKQIRDDEATGNNNMPRGIERLYCRALVFALSTRIIYFKHQLALFRDCHRIIALLCCPYSQMPFNPRCWTPEVCKLKTARLRMSGSVFHRYWV